MSQVDRLYLPDVEVMVLRQATNAYNTLSGNSPITACHSMSTLEVYLAQSAGEWFKGTRQGSTTSTMDI